MTHRPRRVDPGCVDRRPSPGRASGGASADSGRRVTQGELGNLPVLLGLIGVWTYFQFQNHRFLSAGNLTNLMLQIAGGGTISVGVVLVLLLGEIDLSVGSDQRVRRRGDGGAQPAPRLVGVPWRSSPRSSSARSSG